MIEVSISREWFGQVGIQPYTYNIYVSKNQPYLTQKWDNVNHSYFFLAVSSSRFGQRNIGGDKTLYLMI